MNPPLFWYSSWRGHRDLQDAAIKSATSSRRTASKMRFTDFENFWKISYSRFWQGSAWWSRQFYCCILLFRQFWTRCGKKKWGVDHAEQLQNRKMNFQKFQKSKEKWGWTKRKIGTLWSNGPFGNTAVSGQIKSSFCDFEAVRRNKPTPENPPECLLDPKENSGEFWGVGSSRRTLSKSQNELKNFQNFCC